MNWGNKKHMTGQDRRKRSFRIDPGNVCLKFSNDTQAHSDLNPNDGYMGSK